MYINRSILGDGQLLTICQQKKKIGHGCHVGINTNQPLTYKHKENLKIFDFFLSILTTGRLFISRKSQYPRFICYIQTFN